jgi:hypothetical protein
MYTLKVKGGDYMEKGIFYLICSLVLLIAIAANTLVTTSQITKLEKMINAKPAAINLAPLALATPTTVLPTASPSATIKRVVLVTVTPTLVKK